MAENEAEADNESNQNQSVQVISTDSYSQTGLTDVGTECEPLVISDRKDDVEDDPYNDAYRNGNFGIKRGKINFTRAKRWSVAHFFSAIIMTSFTLSCVILLGNNHKYWISSDLRDWFSAITILCCLLGLTMSSCSCYLSSSLAKIRRPLFFLLLVRLLAFLELVFIVTGISLTIAVESEAKERNPWREKYYYYWTTDSPRDIADNFKSFVVLCSFLVISMVVELIMAGAWLFHWWKCCDGCEALKSFCIFEPGEPLASGVSDPPTGIIHECAYVCWSIYKIDLSFII
ncbi:uncharacterized protein LOC116308493 [Actinia tenebrosa]|uniref:Uncharacterized protein LOC116308493 n=1 Tax=Actinia tenebrosa TaxID=6105 RepID=A0A6P8JAM4_ACTTE|nr:uncharacterized protein LOC116308493 [Actinia tenebrosa]